MRPSERAIKQLVKQNVTAEQVARIYRTDVKTVRKWFADYGLPVGSHSTTKYKQRWVTIGGKRFYSRSSWEELYAKYLQFLKINKQIRDWNHETRVFWFNEIKRGVRSYLPDFEIVLNDGKTEFHEVKGWMDPKSATKIKRMAKYYPDITLKVFGKDWFAQNSRMLKLMNID